MRTKKPTRDKKYFTVAEANAILPLARSIVRDIAELANSLQERYDRLTADGELNDVNKEEMEQELEQDQEKMREYVQELQKLGIELKDFHTGLIDFPSLMGKREVYLCWKLGEPEVAHWHELDAGFAGRRKIRLETAGSSTEGSAS
jgi:hypothetical protein